MAGGFSQLPTVGIFFFACSVISSLLLIKQIHSLALRLRTGSEVEARQWELWDESKRDLAKAIKQLYLAVLADLQKSDGQPSGVRERSASRQSAGLSDLLPLHYPQPEHAPARSTATDALGHPSNEKVSGDRTQIPKPKPAVPSKHTKPLLLTRPSNLDARCVA